MTDETQRLLDELAAPGDVSIPDAQAQVLDLLDVLPALARQAARIEGLVRRAELTEKDPEVRGRLEGLKQAMGAVQRIERDMARAANELTTVLSQQIAVELNGIEEERLVVDEAATEAAKQKIMAAHDELDAKGVPKDALSRAVLKEMEEPLARKLATLQKVRTDGLRVVAERAGYRTRAEKRKEK